MSWGDLPGHSVKTICWFSPKSGIASTGTGSLGKNAISQLNGEVTTPQAIKDINSEKKTPSGGSISGGGGGGAPAPSFNLVQGTQGNQIANSINQNNKQPLKAYVVSGDVTSQQSLDRNAKTNASL